MVADEKQLESEAADIIKSYLWSDMMTWVYGDGISSSHHCRRLNQLSRVKEIAGAIGEDCVTAIWKRYYSQIAQEMAEVARPVVPAVVIDAWLSGIEELPAATTLDSENVSGAELLPVSDEGGSWVYGPKLSEPNSPRSLVLSGLRLVILTLRSGDRDIADQLGLPEDACDRSA